MRKLILVGLLLTGCGTDLSVRDGRDLFLGWAYDVKGTLYCIDVDRVTHRQPKTWAKDVVDCYWDCVAFEPWQEPSHGTISFYQSHDDNWHVMKITEFGECKE